MRLFSAGPYFGDGLRADCMVRLCGGLSATPGWKVVAPVHLQTACVRHEPGGLNGDALDEYTRAWAEAVNRSGERLPDAPLVDGQWLCAFPSALHDVEAIWAAIQRHVRATLEQAGPRPVGNGIQDELRHAKLPQGPHLHAQEDLAAAQRKGTEVIARLHFLRLGHLPTCCSGLQVSQRGQPYC